MATAMHQGVGLAVDDFCAAAGVCFSAAIEKNCFFPTTYSSFARSVGERLTAQRDAPTDDLASKHLRRVARPGSADGRCERGRGSVLLADSVQCLEVVEGPRILGPRFLREATWA